MVRELPSHRHTTGHRAFPMLEHQGKVGTGCENDQDDRRSRCLWNSPRNLDEGEGYERFEDDVEFVEA